MVHQQIVDMIITESNHLFKQLLLAHTTLDLGKDTLSGFADMTCITTAVGLNVAIEPIPMYELKSYIGKLPDFLLETFHSKLVQVWNESLTQLFELLVGLHFEGERQFVELKKRNVTLDFRESTELKSQLQESLCNDFNFQSYSDRVKLINSIFNPNRDHDDHMFTISKNIHIRNSFQHRGGKVDEFMQRQLGVQKIPMLDSSGKFREYKLGDTLC